MSDFMSFALMPLSDAARPVDRTIGVYKIINLANGHFYIGSSERIFRRIWTHLNQLRKGEHHCLPLQRAFEKYGESSFSCEVVAPCKDANDALKQEQYLLDAHYQKAHCYNASGSARSPMLVAETREKARVSRNANEKFKNHCKAQMEKMHTPEMRAKGIAASLSSDAFHANSKRQGDNLKRLLSKPVTGKNIDTGEIFEFSSASDAMRFIGAKTTSSIAKQSLLNGNAYGYAWSRPNVI